MPAVEDLMRFDAIHLFAERACAAAPGWQLGDHAAAVTRICTRLDGMALAIELAAARLTVLSGREIDNQLDDRFRLLVDGGGERWNDTARSAPRWTGATSCSLIGEQRLVALPFGLCRRLDAGSR